MRENIWAQKMKETVAVTTLTCWIHGGTRLGTDTFALPRIVKPEVERKLKELVQPPRLWDMNPQEKPFTHQNMVVHQGCTVSLVRHFHELNGGYLDKSNGIEDVAISPSQATSNHLTLSCP